MSLLFSLPWVAFVAGSPFHKMDHSTWLRINDVLVVATLAGVALLGWGLRAASWQRTASAILCYTAVLVSLFMGAYLATTWLFAGEMKWIPLFHRDYSHHGYASVKAYLFSGDNYSELVKLHLFSWMVFSVVYVALGVLAAMASRRYGSARRG